MPFLLPPPQKIIKLLRASFALSLFGDLLFYPRVQITLQESVLLTGTLQPDVIYLESGRDSWFFFFPPNCLHNIFYLIFGGGGFFVCLGFF